MSSGLYYLKRITKLTFVRRVMKFAGIALLRDGNLLLCKRSPNMERYPSTWSVPAGYVEDSETTSECAVRELWEETHISILEKYIKLAGIIDKKPGSKKSPRNPNIKNQMTAYNRYCPINLPYFQFSIYPSIKNCDVATT